MTSKRGRKPCVKFFESPVRKTIPLHQSFSNDCILRIDAELETPEPVVLSARPVQSHEDSFAPFGITNVDKLYSDQVRKRKEMDAVFETSTGPSSTITTAAAAAAGPSTPRDKKFFEMYTGMLEDSGNEWPARTTVHCWWCVHQFDTVPIGYPIAYRPSSKKYLVRGVFCGFSCALSYISGVPAQNKSLPLLKNMYFAVTGEHPKTLVGAPDKHTLKIFGGELSIEEFRSANRIGKMYQMVEYPFLFTKDFVREHTVSEFKADNDKSLKKPKKNTQKMTIDMFIK